MIGNNEMKLNHACIVEAVQMWLDAQMKDGKSPIVESISGSGSYGAQEFTVKIVEKKESA